MPTEEKLALFRDAAAERFTRCFYPPPLWKVNAAVMFWKASKEERGESGDEHFGVGTVSCGLGQLVSLGKVVAQRLVRRSTWPVPRCWPSRRLTPTCC
jgi:hypothetical protein